MYICTFVCLLEIKAHFPVDMLKFIRFFALHYWTEDTLDFFFFLILNSNMKIFSSTMLKSYQIRKFVENVRYWFEYSTKDAHQNQLENEPSTISFSTLCYINVAHNTLWMSQAQLYVLIIIIINSVRIYYAFRINMKR